MRVFLPPHKGPLQEKGGVFYTDMIGHAFSEVENEEIRDKLLRCILGCLDRPHVNILRRVIAIVHRSVGTYFICPRVVAV